MIKVPTGWRVYYWCTLLSQSKPCDLRVTRRVNSLLPSNSNLPRLPGWPWLRTPCCLAGLADCLLCSPPVLSSCLAVPLTHVWTAASTARHRQAHHTTPHHTTPHNFSRVLKLGPQIFFLVKIANTNFIFNLVNVFHQALFAAPDIFGKILFYQLLIFWLNFQLKFIIGKKFNAKESF